MKCTAKEVLQYVEENDVKFVKLAFCDLFGRQKNVSIVSQQLPAVFENGYLFNSTAVEGFENCAGDLLLFPDAKTLSVLPWRPQTGEVVSLLTYVKRLDGSFYEGDTLHLLDVAKQKLSKLGLSCEIASECEFYVFKLDSAGNPTDTPIDHAGYLDSAPEDEGENIRRDIILSLEDMGIVPTSSHHEKGPGQNEIDFMQTEPSGAARNLLYFKSAVKNVCRMCGVSATFEPKPLADNVCSGLRVVLTLGGVNASAAKLDSFAAGVLEKAAEFIPFFNTTPDSFKLFDEMRAPAQDNGGKRDAYVRALPGADGTCRIEINSADGLFNPFLGFALLLEAGVYGIENKLESKHTAYPGGGDKLPDSLEAALSVSEKSKWLKSVLTENILSEYLSVMRAKLA